MSVSRADGTRSLRRRRVSMIGETVNAAEIERRLAAGEQPVAAWTSWERVEMPNAMLRVLGVALVSLIALMGFVLLYAPSLRLKYVAASTLADSTAQGRQVAQLAHQLAHTPGGIAHGLLLAGNSTAELAAARAAGQRFVRLRYAYTPDAVTGAVRTLLGETTPNGAKVLLHDVGSGSLGKRAIEDVILGDSGVVALREFGTGAYSFGVAPGVVRVVVPLVGRLRSRHFPYDGALSGLPLYGTALVTVRKGADARWRLDDLADAGLDSLIVAAWGSYHFATRPRPAVVIDGRVVPPDSVWRVAVARGATYRDQH